MAQRFAAARVGANSRIDAKTTHPEELSDHASLGARMIAYLIDSVVLAGLALLFFAAAGLNIYLRSDAGRESVSDAAITDSFVILMATVPAWFALNFGLAVRRGQSLGKYVIGLQAVRVDGRPAGPLRHLVHWLALHPLLFHPLIGMFFGAFAIYSVSFAESLLLLYGGLTIALLCLLAPAAGLFFALGDAQRRGLHDWIAAMKAVRIA
jgi:uncharacterized RDD family membrane protein YckC